MGRDVNGRSQLNPGDNERDDETFQLDEEGGRTVVN
jgi:hypothetical protein